MYTYIYIYIYIYTPLCTYVYTCKECEDHELDPWTEPSDQLYYIYYVIIWLTISLYLTLLCYYMIYNTISDRNVFYLR